MHGGVCVVAPGGACMVLFRGACVVLFGGCAWFYSRGHAWFYSGGRHAWFYSGGGVCGFFSFYGYNEIRSMSGRYTSYWNAFLLVDVLRNQAITVHRNMSQAVNLMLQCCEW